jgi:hypothetical protein
VFGGLNRLLVGATVAGVVLVAPPAALACNNGVSAVNVYKECIPTGGGSKPTTGNKSSKSSAPTTTTNPAPPVTVSSGTKKAIKHVKKHDRRVLFHLVKRFGPTTISASETSAAAPSAIGSAFDLGSGPTALLVVLAGTAVLLLAAAGVRGARHRRS